MLRRSRRVFIGWIALTAIWAVTLMPTFSRLFAAAPDTAAACPLHRAMASHGTSDPSSGDSTQAGFGDACPFCVLAADLAPPPPQLDGGVGVTVAFQPLPHAFLHATRASGIWLAARSRAPPRDA